MNFFKTFLITLVIYLVLNAVFALIMVFTSDFIPDDDVVLIIAFIFVPGYASSLYPQGYAITPDYAFIFGLTNMFKFAYLETEIFIPILFFMAMIIPPLIAVIVGGVLADTSSQAFLSWFLTALLSTIIYTIILAATFATSTGLGSLYLSMWKAYGPTDLSIALILSGIISGLFYGCISFLVTRKKL